jgi:hypothetical protein
VRKGVRRGVRRRGRRGEGVTALLLLCYYAPVAFVGCRVLGRRWGGAPVRVPLPRQSRKRGYRPRTAGPTAGYSWSTGHGGGPAARVGAPSPVSVAKGKGGW